MNPPLVVGNWKMHGGAKTCAELARSIATALTNQPVSVEVGLAPPFTSLLSVQGVLTKSQLKLAAQNCHWEDSGAFTGEVSPSMLREIGCDFVLVGHSERRHIFCESDDMVRRKVAAVIRHGMRPILCVGETNEERKSEQTSAVIARQLDSALKGVAEDGIDMLDIAYEPVWAIGTGLNATGEQIHEAHSQIRNFLMDRFDKAKGEPARILYGGSVNAKNAEMIARVDSVNGLLVGGASLAAESFLAIIRALSTK